MFQFSIGGMFGVANGGNVATTPADPQFFGTIQDVSVEFDAKGEELRGQLQYPDDVAHGDKSIKGKASFGRLEIGLAAQLYTADAITTGIKSIIPFPGESGTVGAGPNTYQTTNHTTFIEDLGVFNPATGQKLTQVSPGSEVAGSKYSVNSATGTYTFAVGDAGKVYSFYYVWTNAAAGSTLAGVNHVQGYGPQFELWLQQNYQNVGNGLHLWACKCTKMSAPHKRSGYVISDFEFIGFANAAGNVYEWFQVSI